jgi:hypothetical protein
MNFLERVKEISSLIEVINPTVYRRERVARQSRGRWSADAGCLLHRIDRKV